MLHLLATGFGPSRHLMRRAIWSLLGDNRTCRLRQIGHLRLNANMDSSVPETNRTALT
jgi:hypothetical protein